MNLKNRLKYHVYAEKNSNDFWQPAKIRERGIGSFLYSSEYKRYLKGQAKLLSENWLEYNISITPNQRGFLVGWHAKRKNQ